MGKKFWETHRLSLKPEQVPHKFHHLIPLAERWGIHDHQELNDDEVQQTLLNEATEAELRSLVNTLQLHMSTSGSEVDLYEWLAGDEAELPIPSEAYIAFTLLTLAFDEAELRLRKSEKL
ncbi:MAG: hypothetical protein AAFU54_06815 [Chloroflexota bacterium]